MRITLHRGVFLAVVLIVAGLAFLSAYRVTSAACCTVFHGTVASGIPYWPGAYELTNNYTYYVTEHTGAIDRWNDKTARDYLHLLDSTHDTGDMTQYMVYTGSGWDTLLGAYFVQPSCQDLVDDVPSLLLAAAFEWGWGSSNNDNYMTVVCLNVTVLGFTEDPFDGHTAEERIKIVSQEMGHSLHLAHDTTGVMDQCHCKNITQHEADVIHWKYASPP